MQVQLINIPKTCPICGGPTTIKKDPKSGVLTLWCDNPNCSAKSNRSMEHFVSRNAMNVDGLSSATLNALIANGVVTDYASLYHVNEHTEIMTWPGFGIKSFSKLCDSIEKSRTVKPANLIYALGIPNVGLSTAKLISENFNNNIAAMVRADFSVLMNIDGVGATIAESFTDYFADDENMNEFIQLCNELNIVQEEVHHLSASEATMAGMVFCITGKVYRFPNRDTVKSYIEAHGGKLTGSVSASTSFLITNDTTSGSNKNKAAQKYGIPILSEDDFIAKFNIQGY